MYFDAESFNTVLLNQQALNHSECFDFIKKARSGSTAAASSVQGKSTSRLGEPYQAPPDRSYLRVSVPQPYFNQQRHVNRPLAASGFGFRRLVVVFTAFSLLDSNTVKCLYPFLESADSALVMVLPPVLGVITGVVFIVFPYTRHGTGYPPILADNKDNS
ncbi:putative methyltransferase TARBP1-like [Hibiscus syriacus]|uniref:Methyltransferase TARBP1-like n=1 Tax=Hibiscus syriacus TaxID=106335 RepID=A0A6A2X0T3_HIBSY|nr:putative methyltransferase TARBP1-like [Hibiscus syriacus]